MNAPTEVNERARIDLVRMLANYADFVRVKKARDTMRGDDPNLWPEWCPLFEGKWRHDDADMITAVREATLLGHIESNALHASNDQVNRVVASLRGGQEWMLRITPLGYDWIVSRLTSLGETLTGRAAGSGAEVVSLPGGAA